MLIGPRDDRGLGPRLNRIADRTSRAAHLVDIVFITNLRADPLVDRDAGGVVNLAQYYRRDQADTIIGSLQASGFNVISFFDETSFFRWALDNGPSTERTTVVLNTAEGGRGPGRRALVPAFCNLVGLPLVNSGAHANSLCRHKFHANAVLARVGVRVPDTWMFDGEWVGGLRPTPGLRIIVKPTYESMSIGIDKQSVMHVGPRIDEDVLRMSRELNQAVVAQEFIVGDEVGVPVLRAGSAHALPIIAFRRADGTPFGDKPKTFADESLDHDVSHHQFATEPGAYRNLQRQAELTFDALGMDGAGRIDLRVDSDGQGWVFDTGESPPPLIPTAYSRALELVGVPAERMLELWVGLRLLQLGAISGI